MIKKWLISMAFKIAMWIIALGLGIWYLSSAIGDASLSYISVDSFMDQIGVEEGDIATANGCFLCRYIQDLFGVLGTTTETFWNAIVHNLWILMAVGFGMFVLIHTIQYMRENMTSKDVKDMTNKEPVFEFKKWFEKVWKTGVRVMIAGALIGGLSISSTSSLRAVTHMVVSPVMYMGTSLSMAATGVITHAKCEIPEQTETPKDVLNPVLKPLMCVMGNLNTVMLAGAAGGFALMNYAWLGLGGGAITWVAGLALVILFLVVGFNLFFQILTVLFKLIFIIIFMPLLIAATAFEQVWGLAKGLMNASISMLINSAISILKISIKIIIMFTLVYTAADKFYPGPGGDHFTTILPPLIAHEDNKPTDPAALSVMEVFSTCEKEAKQNGYVDKATFKQCFERQKAVVEAKYPHAFDFMGSGFDFFFFMLSLIFLYYWVVSPKVDNILKADKEDKEQFDYGDWLKNAGKTAFKAPEYIYTKVKEKLG